MASPVIPAGDSEALTDLFYGYAHSTLLFPLQGWVCVVFVFLRWYAFSQYCKARWGAKSLSFL